MPPIQHTQITSWHEIPPQFAVSAKRDKLDQVGMIGLGRNGKALEDRWQDKAFFRNLSDRGAYSPGIMTCTGIAMLFKNGYGLIHLSPDVIKKQSLLGEVVAFCCTRHTALQLGKIKKFVIVHEAGTKTRVQIEVALLEIVREFEALDAEVKNKASALDIQIDALSPDPKTGVVAVHSSGQIGTLDKATRVAVRLDMS